MNLDFLLRETDLPASTADTAAALAATVRRGRRQRRARVLAAGGAVSVAIAVLAGVLLSMDRGDRHQVVAGPPPDTDTTAVPSVPEPGDAAVWEVDPADRASLSRVTSFTALVTRLGCSSGVTGRVLRPGVVVTDTEVVVTFTVAANPVGGECPGNDQVPYEVVVGEPIGDRVLVDGACLEDDAGSTSFCEDGGIRRRDDVQSPFATPPAPDLNGRLLTGEPFVVSTSVDGLCVVLDEVDLGCDAGGPVVGVNAPLEQPRIALPSDAAYFGDGVLAYAYLPEGAVDVVGLNRQGRPVAEGAFTNDRLWGLPLERGHVPFSYVFLDRQGREVDREN